MDRAPPSRDRLIALDADQWLLASQPYASDPETVNRAMDYAQFLPCPKLYPVAFRWNRFGVVELVHGARGRAHGRLCTTRLRTPPNRP